MRQLCGFQAQPRQTLIWLSRKLHGWVFWLFVKCRVWFYERGISLSLPRRALCLAVLVCFKFISICLGITLFWYGVIWLTAGIAHFFRGLSYLCLGTVACFRQLAAFTLVGTFLEPWLPVLGEFLWSLWEFVIDIGDELVAAFPSFTGGVLWLCKNAWCLAWWCYSCVPRPITWVCAGVLKLGIGGLNLAVASLIWGFTQLNFCFSFNARWAAESSRLFAQAWHYGILAYLHVPCWAGAGCVLCAGLGLFLLFRYTLMDHHNVYMYSPETWFYTSASLKWRNNAFVGGKLLCVAETGINDVYVQRLAGVTIEHGATCMIVRFAASDAIAGLTIFFIYADAMLQTFSLKFGDGKLSREDTLGRVAGQLFFKNVFFDGKPFVWYDYRLYKKSRAYSFELEGWAQFVFLFVTLRRPRVWHTFRIDYSPIALMPGIDLHAYHRSLLLWLADPTHIEDAGYAPALAFWQTFAGTTLISRFHMAGSWYAPGKRGKQPSVKSRSS